MANATGGAVVLKSALFLLILLADCCRVNYAEGEFFGRTFRGHGGYV